MPRGVTIAQANPPSTPTIPWNRVSRLTRYVNSHPRRVSYNFTNTVDPVNPVEPPPPSIRQATKLRYLRGIDFLAGKAAQQSSVLQRIREELDPEHWPNQLIPEVHEVFERTTSAADSLVVDLVGSFGLRGIKSSGLGPRRVVYCNIERRTCDGSDPDCVRPALTKEACAHLQCAYRHERTMENAPLFFAQYYPPYFLRDQVLNFLKLPSTGLVPPNMKLYPPRKDASYSEHGATKVPRGNNSVRYRSTGEVENDFN